MSDNNPNRRLSEFLVGLITGTADIGLSLLPLLGLYKAQKDDPEWREQAFQDWLINDPKAAKMLCQVLERVKSRLPEETRMTMILALGGVPV